MTRYKGIPIIPAPGNLPGTPDLRCWKDVELPKHWKVKVPEMVENAQYIKNTLGPEMASLHLEETVDELIEEEKNEEQNDE